MAKRSKKPAGVGAIGRGMSRFFHPKKKIQQKWPAPARGHALDDVIVLGKEQHRINKKEQLSYRVRIPAIDDGSEFWISCHNFKVTIEGPTPFPDETPSPPSDREANSADSLRGQFTNVNNIGRGASAADIADLRAQGIEVDNEDPAPENLGPPPVQPEAVGEWVRPSICPRRANSSIHDLNGCWTNKSWQTIGNMSELALFRMCFPEAFISDVLIPETNRQIEGEKMDLQEFYVYLGCHFFMACFEGISDRRAWWSKQDVSMFDGAPFRLGGFMSFNRFKAIAKAMTYTNKPVPTTFEDRFHEVRQMLTRFNEHYEADYCPSWMNTLDESVNSFTDQNCPGFMCIPRKPHPFGNEYHSIADGDGGKPIMWRIKLQEGKDRPKKPDGSFAFATEFERAGFTKTASLMLFMTKNIHHTGKIVTMDSGFCVKVGIEAMDKYGVYGQALIKKKRYWPRGVPGDQIDEHFNNKALGYSETLKQVADGKQFLIHCTKEEKYVTKLMSTHGLINEVPDHTTYRYVNGEWVSFKYTEPISRHNNAKHWVDDVNNRRHAPIGLEDVWATKWWPDRQFTFICSVAEVNAVMSQARGRNDIAEQTLKFRRRLAQQMLENKIIDTGQSPCSPATLRKCKRLDGALLHTLETRKTFTGKWDSRNGTWTKVKSKYLKSQCKTCKFECRTYCSCQREVTMCTKCWADHKSVCSNTS